MLGGSPAKGRTDAILALGDENDIELEHEAGDCADMAKGCVLQRFLGLFWHHAQAHAVARAQTQNKMQRKDGRLVLLCFLLMDSWDSHALGLVMLPRLHCVT